MNIDPKELESSDLNQQLDEALAGFSSDDLAALAHAPTPAQPRRDAARGQIQGTIIDIRGAEVFVDIGGKSEAYLTLDEFDPDSPPQPGQVRTFIMHGVDPASGQVRLSLRETRSGADASALRPGDVVEARVTGVNIGGLELQIKGLRAFMPKSQVDLNRIEDFTPFIGRRMECEVSEVDRRGKTIVLSRRKLLERQREQVRSEMKDQIAEGQVRKGVVRRLTDFGAFVDIGGIEGLLHISDISYARIGKAADALSVGQEIEVKILRIDAEKDRIALGLKQLAPDPWNLVEGNYRVGSQVDGRVLRLEKFGAFVELEPGVDGLLPISEMSWTQRVLHPKDILAVGDSVRVALLGIDPEKRKITLSLKALGSDPWNDVAARYAPDMVVSGRVTRLADFGAFVQLEEGIEGLIHISEMSDKRIRAVGDVVKPDQVISVRVKGVDPEQRRISLTLKGIGPDGKLIEAAPAEATPAARPAAAKRKKPLRGGLE